MSEWKEARLGEVLNITMGLSPRGEYCNNTGIGMPLLNGPTEFGLYSPNPVQFTTEITKLSEVGDILFCVRGSTTGRMNWSDRKYVIGRGIAAISHKKGYEYRYYAKALMDFYLPSILSFSTGSTFPNVTKDVLNNLPIIVPSLFTQKKISNLLLSLDEKIQINNQINQKLEEIAQAVFKSWFVDFEPFQDGGFIESELGMIPKGWKVVEFGEIVDTIIDNRGKTPPLVDKGIPMIEGNNINLSNKFPVLTNKQKFVSEETYNNWFRAGHPEYLDILCATVGTLPKWCYMLKDIKLCIAQNIVAFKASKVCSPYYLFSYMNSYDFIKRFNGRIVATAQPSIKIGHLTSIKIVLPPKSVLNKFDTLLRPIIEKIYYNFIQNQKLSIVRDELLPKLISGEVRVGDEI